MDRIEEAPKAYDLCGKVIGAAMKVHSALGPGFLESVYQNALIWELRKGGFKAEAGSPISVQYDGQIVGVFTADLLVNDALIVELKASPIARGSARRSTRKLSCRNPNRRGVLVNFGAERMEFKKKFRVPKKEQVSF
jgi:GxxExxY protein